jgi:mono/diheme cytochrome c family protein
VGSTIWEEVNRIERGVHYQFPVVEGRNPTGRAGWENLDLTQQGPIYTYQHDAYDRAVIGGVVYRGDRYPSLQGKYVFADNYSAKIFVIPADQQQVDEAQEIARANQYAQRGVSSVVQMDSGEILVTTLGAASAPSGEVLLLVAAEDADVVEDRDDTASEESVEYDEVAVASLFAVNCARCHGEDGAGQGPDASLLGVELPDFTSLEFQSGTSAESLYEVIAEGGAAVGISPMMPPWSGALSSQEIEHLVTYIESLPNSD